MLPLELGTLPENFLELFGETVNRVRFVTADASATELILQTSQPNPPQSQKQPSAFPSTLNHKTQTYLKLI